MKNPSYLFANPPFTQLNTSYPAISYLAGFMRRQSIEAHQADLSIETFCQIFSRKGLQQVVEVLETYTDLNQPEALHFLQRKQEYLQKIDPVMRFLQGKDETLADRIVSRTFLPEGKRFQNLSDLEWAFGTMGTGTQAKHFCTLFLEDIGDVISNSIDHDFAFSRYAESIARDAHNFDLIEETLQLGYSFVVEICIQLLQVHIEKSDADVICFSVPFPGNVLMALQCAKFIKENYPDKIIVLGGGFVNTELRKLTDPRIFKYVDYITLDDGELPLLQLNRYLVNGKQDKSLLSRCFMLEKGEIAYYDNELANDFDHNQTGWPDYEGLTLDQYLSFIEIANPMHRLWSDGRWNKMTLAHGCYWHRCTFCDTELDYIKRYSQTDAGSLCDRIESIIQQTGNTGFHFVDEAASPAVLRELALELLRRGITISWWTNIRFDKAFTADLCRLLAKSGCIAVSGGLEVASDRVLKLINKNVSIQQAAKTAYYFTSNGVMVHTYLMYGFPTQTEQETVDSLEVVRQLMEAGLVQSGFWHKFTLTEHSPVSKDPEAYGIEIIDPETNSFANNDLQHYDNSEIDHDRFSEGLRKAIYNYMHGICFDVPVQKWFGRGTRPATVSPFLIENFIAEAEQVPMPPLNRKMYFVGSEVKFQTIVDRSGKKIMKVTAFLQEGPESCMVPEPIGWWVERMLPKMYLDQLPNTMLSVQQDYTDSGLFDFKRFLYSPLFDLLCKAGLVIV